MGIQLSLFIDPTLAPPTPSDERSSPAVWVRRLWILRELSPGEEHVVRRLDLRRGLNVLWAAPTGGGEENRLFQGKLSGHTAGKTTFCRIVRHLLGEPTFGTQSARNRIRGKLPTAWAVGEIYAGGELWTVARPLGIGPHPFAIRGAPFDAIFEGAPREEYARFVEAVEAATTAELPVSRFTHVDETIRWEHLLPWLSRDQESRFTSFAEWRDPTSEAESPMLVAEDRHLLVRAVLDLISDEERAEQRKNAELVAKKQDAAARAPLVAHQAAVDRQRLAVALGIKDDRRDGPLFEGDHRASLTARRAALDEAEAALTRGDRAEGLREAWELAVAARAEASRDLRDAEAHLAAERTAAAELAGAAPAQTQLALMPTTLPPGRAFCSVPLSVARAEGCPLAMARPGEARKIGGKKAAESDAARQEEVVRALEAGVALQQDTLAKAQAAEQDAHRALAATDGTRREELDRILRERTSLDRAEWLLAEAEGGQRGVEAGEEELGRLEKALRRSYDRQESFRKRHAEALGKISDRFAYVIHAVLGEQMTGRIEDDGRHLALRVEEHGERESAAVATIKLLAFDLAALTASIEGHGHFPRFLLHDGPREADMDQTIYERLFLYAQSLEERYRGEPGFQYIITTTAPPPVTLQRAPWLVEPVLDASKAEGRLLGIDL